MPTFVGMTRRDGRRRRCEAGVGITRRHGHSVDCKDIVVLISGNIAEVGLDRAGGLHGQRLAAPVEGLADGDPDPAFAYAVFLDIRLLDALEPDPGLSISAPRRRLR